MLNLVFCKSEIDFVCLVVLLSVLLYSNTIPSGYVWDDRAAIIGNADVHGTDHISKILEHDFWGQDMTLSDSHKSYRPLTVLTYRFNHNIHGLSAMGFHVGNVVVYTLACIAFYALASIWVRKSSAQIATLLFCVHPVHVESVASIVGRADALCGVLFCLACIFYSWSLASSTATQSAGAHTTPILRIVYFAAALMVAIMASLSKEIGITVFGVFVIMEVLYYFENYEKYMGGGSGGDASGSVAATGDNSTSAPTSASSSSNAPSSNGAKKASQAQHQYPMHVFLTALYHCFTSLSSLLKVLTSIAVVALFLYKRASLHGNTAQNFLYEWTILENHINLLPSLRDRVLSYAQSHFWYMFKLFYPRYLCFDYGFICIPTIHAFADVRNLLPLITYSGVIGLAIYSLVAARIAYIVGLTFLLVPLLPALNILFPVGTILAERLLFIPSMGFCIIIAEFLTVDLAHIWVAVGSYVYVRLAALYQPHVVDKGGKSTPRSKKSNNGQGQEYSTLQASSLPKNTAVGIVALMLCVVLPIVIAGSIRIYTRNIDWQSEAAIYRSALDVCPDSVKALNNDAVLSFSTGDYASSLKKIEHSINLYPGHAHAYLNAGVASNKLGDKIKALYYYDTGIRVSQATNKHKQSNAKNYAYKGMLLFDWSQQDPLPDALLVEEVLREGKIISRETGEPVSEAQLVQNVRDRLLDAAEIAMDTAIKYGFDQPSVLHSRASLAIQKQDFETAIYYLKYAIQFTMEANRNPDVPKQDLINEPLSLNQLAIAYASIGDHANAEKSYLEGLQFDPASCELLSNLGNLYRAQGKYAEAKVYFQRCLDARSGSNGQKDFAARAAKAQSVAALYNTPRGPPPAALLNNFGILELDHLNNAEEGVIMFQQALDIVRAGGARTGYDVMQNNYNRAIEALNQKR